jgi:hypothetical protein
MAKTRVDRGSDRRGATDEGYRDTWNPGPRRDMFIPEPDVPLSWTTRRVKCSMSAAMHRVRAVTKRDSETIYVALLDDGIDVRRPVKARRLPNGAYLILEQAYDRSTETWQFKPETVVSCRVEQRHGRQITIATEMARHSAG